MYARTSCTAERNEILDSSFRTGVYNICGNETFAVPCMHYENDVKNAINSCSSNMGRYKWTLKVFIS